MKKLVFNNEEKQKIESVQDKTKAKQDRILTRRRRKAEILREQKAIENEIDGFED